MFSPAEVMSVRAGTGEIVAERFFSVNTSCKLKNSDHKPSALVTEPWLSLDYNIKLTKQKYYKLAEHARTA